ncbi:MAG: hypothetical protein A2046_05820 [Bacteroidetes bacterium GWA2_30_7]|nr:MAG: hypothetical protein A2046_05820 [Bacteroidetes bacterium GWA2_30_7]
MNKYNIPLEPDKYYHIYNHAVGKSNLFETEGNYFFFLEKYKQYISSYVDTFAYCLLPNHFHLAVRIKNVLQFPKLSESFKLSESLGNSVPTFISKQFSNFFSCYSQSFNKQQSRRGGLFEHKFRRKHISTEAYFKNLIHYIHYNPVHHGFVEDLRDWKFTSYESYFSPKATLLKRDEVISWFQDKKGFEEFHKRELDDKMIIEFE